MTKKLEFLLNSGIKVNEDSNGIWIDISSFNKKNLLKLIKLATNDKNQDRVKRGKTQSKSNPWILHVKKFKEEHPEVKGAEIMKEAKKTYSI